GEGAPYTWWCPHAAFLRPHRCALRCTSCLGRMSTMAAARRPRRYTASPLVFAGVRGGGAGRGGTAVVSVPLAGKMSGTVESALLAARAAEIPVHVVDSGVLGLALGFAVISAAEAAQRGGGPAEVAAAAKARADATSSFFYV